MGYSSGLAALYINSFAADFLAPSAGFLGGKNLKTGYPPNFRKYGDYHRQRH